MSFKKDKNKMETEKNLFKSIESKLRVSKFYKKKISNIDFLLCINTDIKSLIHLKNVENHFDLSKINECLGNVQIPTVKFKHIIDFYQKFFFFFCWKNSNGFTIILTRFDGSLLYVSENVQQLLQMTSVNIFLLNFHLVYNSNKYKKDILFFI